jgi:histidyl-tRNA synthetase
MLQKELQEDVAVKLGEYLLGRTNRDTETDDILELLRTDPLLLTNADIKKGLEEMELLLRYLKAYRVGEYVQLDLSLPRGLDYYTGLIYEVVLDSGLKSREESLSVGGIAAGGRYDNLVGKFSNCDIPCVGISFGIDRILTILKAIKQDDAASEKSIKVEVWIIIASNKPCLVEERMTIARELRQVGVSVDFDPKADKKPRKQLDVTVKYAKTVMYLKEDDTKPDLPGRVRIKTLEVENLTEGPRECRHPQPWRSGLHVTSHAQHGTTSSQRSNPRGQQATRIT